MSATDDLLHSNAAYARAFDAAALPAEPALQVAVVACMDARIDVHRILGFQLGDAHVIRNAGGIVTDDVLRSLVVSQRLLGTREIVLIHHTRCGMMPERDEELLREVEAETGLRPSFAFGTFSELELDVRASIDRITEDPFIPHKDSVRGFVYEVETGRLREV